MTHFTRLLVATDFSPSGDAALATAVDLATQLGARLTVLYVSEVPAVLAGEALALGDRFMDADLAHGRDRLARVLDDLRARGMAAESRVRVGFAPEMILEEADPRRYDLLVIGTHGRTGVRRLWVGSVAERVMRSCRVPVLTVRAPHGK